MIFKLIILLISINLSSALAQTVPSFKEIESNNRDQSNSINNNFFSLRNKKEKFKTTLTCYSNNGNIVNGLKDIEIEKVNLAKFSGYSEFFLPNGEVIATPPTSQCFIFKKRVD